MAVDETFRTVGGIVDAAGSARSPMSIGEYIATFSLDPNWSELVDWPPDVFALANLVLTHTETYRYVVAPPRGQRWPPEPGWGEWVADGGAEWRATAATGDRAPARVRELWGSVVDHIDRPVDELRDGGPATVWMNLVSLHAMADEACAHLSTASTSDVAAEFARRAWGLMDAHGSLSRVSPGRIRILPKTNLAQRGITIRSLSRYLALSYEPIDLAWRKVSPVIDPGSATRRSREYNAVLVPWPLHLSADAFRPVEGPLDNLDRSSFGFFEFAPDTGLDVALLAGVLVEARRAVDHVDAVIFPESAVEPSDIAVLEALLSRHGVSSLITGVRQSATDGLLGYNYVHVGVRTDAGWERFHQFKHHRWCLDENQIRQYHLCRSLKPGRQWWEAIDLPKREVQVVDMGGGTTLAPLVCEDLARLDEVADVLRCIGPSLVVALLLDGPQLATRWPFRYASVLADDPGSAVLTLTSHGMAIRSRPPGHPRSRVVALWNDPATGRHELALGRGAAAILITASVASTTVFTADGRSHPRRTPAITLSKVTQLRSRPTTGGDRRS